MGSEAKRFSKKKGSKVTLKHHLKSTQAIAGQLAQEGVVGAPLVRAEDVKFRNY